MEASSAVGPSSVHIFLLSFFRQARAFLTLQRAKPDDTAAERRSISASRNASQCNSQGCDGVAPQNCESSSSIALAAVEDLLVQPVTALTRFFRSELTGGTCWALLQPSALPECRKINSGRGIPSCRAIAGAKLQSDILMAIGNP